MTTQEQPPTKAEKVYFKSRREILDREVKDLARLGRFDEVEDEFYSYGQFLERHPAAMTA